MSKRNLTKPNEVQDYVPSVDVIIDEIEKQIKTVKMDEFGRIQIRIPGEFELNAKQEVVLLYREIGWNLVTFSRGRETLPKTNDTINKTHTVFTFKK